MSKLNNNQEEELVKYIDENQMKIFLTRFIGLAKIWIIFTIIGGSFLPLMHIVVGVAETKSGYAFVINSIYAVGYLCVGFVVISIRPKWMTIMIPFSVTFFSILAADVLTQSEEYKCDELFMTLQAFSGLAMMAIPTQKYINFAFHAAGLIYINLKVYCVYGSFQSMLLVHTINTLFYMYASSSMLYNKVKEIYSVLFTNEKLLKEIRRLIEIFPEGVLIKSKDRDTNMHIYSANYNFENNIWNLHNEFNDLENIQVEVKHRDASNLELSRRKLNLEELLEKQEAKIRMVHYEEFENISIAIEQVNNQNQVPNEQSDNVKPVYKHYNVKSLTLDWEGRKSFMHVFIDTTNIIQLEEAQNSIKWQKIMFSSASHEFRNPLNAILNSFSLLETRVKSLENTLKRLGIFNRKYKESIDKDFEMIRKFTKMGSNSSTLLMAFVEDILNLSKFENENFEIRESDFKLKELIDEVTEIFSYQSTQKHLEFKINVSLHLINQTLHSDKGAIKQVLINLISNSLKFTFEGEIIVNIQVQSHNNQLWIEFEVRDTGIGIEYKNQQKIFKLFGMINIQQSTTEINPNGCGIGLTVSKKYIESLGGKIKLLSEPRVGTSVVFTIPAAYINEVNHIMDDEDFDIFDSFESWNVKEPFCTYSKDPYKAKWIRASKID